MSKILEGLGRAISSLWPSGINSPEISQPVEHNTETVTLEDQFENEVNQALAAERENIKASREDMDNFSWVTGDNNPIHRLQKRAVKMGFTDTPVMGAHIAAYAEQYVTGVVQRMSRFWGADIKVIGQEVTFKSPLYPGERTLWQVKGFEKKGDSIDVKVQGTANNQPIVDVTTNLGTKYPIANGRVGPTYSRRFLQERDHLEAFCNSVGAKFDEKVYHHMLNAAYVPATLLRLLEDRTGSTEGMITRMSFDFFEESKPGKLQVDIFPSGKSRPQYKEGPKISENGNPVVDGDNNKPIIEKILDAKGQPIVEGYIYRFKSAVSRRPSTDPIMYGEVTTFCPYKIEFD